MTKGNSFRHIDERAIQASGDVGVLEQFILDERGFILASAGKVLSRHVEKDSEEELTAMEAFAEAVQSYSFDKGSFLSFAELVIKRRLIDEIRKAKKHAGVIAMDPSDLTGEQESRQDRAAGAADELRSDIASEIIAVGKILEGYGFSFFDLTDSSPKAGKTREACRDAVLCILKSGIMLPEMRRSRVVPIKIIEKNTGLPRKILERHRKYIIAAAEILNGDFPCLSEYISYIKKEL